MFFSYINNVSRFFQYDYVYIDAFFLLIWLVILFWQKKYKALLFGLVIVPIIYIIDAFVWWNSFSGGHYIREYWINGMALPHPLGQNFWLKFKLDFMMTISYALFTFPWLWLTFEALRNGKVRQIFKFSAIWLGFWLAVPLLSFYLNIDNRAVESVRHMASQNYIWLINFIVGFGFLAILYRKELLLVGKIFVIGVVGGLIMELPLFIFNIRPTQPGVLIFDAIFMLNQGVPYLFILFDKVFFRQRKQVLW